MEKYCRYHFLACHNQSPYTPNQPQWYCPQCKLVLNDEDLIELESCVANNKRNLYLKKMKKQRRLAIIILVLFIIISSTASIIYNSPKAKMERRMDAFNELCVHYETYGPKDQYYENDYQDYVYEQHSELTELCGLGTGYFEYADYIMDADFVNAYIEHYSAEEFIENLFYIYQNRDDICYDYEKNEYCGPRTINTVLLIALENAGIEIAPFAIPKEGSDGYYTEHPEEVLESEIWEVSGSFYSSTGENRHIQTRTCSTTVTVHGDFMIEHYSGYSYYEGAYEWRDGVFYDVLPRWISRSDETIYYKGKVIHENMDGAEIFYVGGICYVLFGPEDCGYSDDHTSRDWKILGQ